jgi:hypothetical protein
VAMMPAGGAAIFSLLYSADYNAGSEPDSTVCIGSACFTGWAWGCAASVGVAIVLWGFAWRTWKSRGVSV